MATFTQKPLSIVGDDSFLSYHVRQHEEASSQTFLRDSPVIYSSGLITIAAEPVAVGTLAGFAVKAGQNGTASSDLLAEFVPAVPGMLFFANFLADTGTTNALATADFGDTFQMQVASFGSHIADVKTTPALFLMVSGEADETLSTGVNRATNGDSDARCLFQVLEGACIPAVVA